MSQLEDKVRLSGSKFQRQKSYWTSALTEMPLDEAILLTDYEYVAEYSTDTLSMDVPYDLKEKLIKLSKNSDLALFILLLSNVCILASKYTDNERSTIAIPAYNHNDHLNIQNELLLLCESVEGHLTFKEFLMNVRKNVLSVYDNQEYPLGKVLESLGLSQEECSNSFDLLCTMSNIHTPNSKASPKQVVFTFEKTETALYIHIKYNPLLYTRNTIELLHERYLLLLTQVFANPNLTLEEVSILTAEEEQLLLSFHGEALVYPANETICSLFEQQVQKTPHQYAVAANGEYLTYMMLNERANRLAATLIAKGVSSNNVVGILSNSRLEMVVGMLGILKAGGAYLPIDPKYPEERILYMLEESKANVLVTLTCFEDRANSYEGIRLLLDKEETYSPSVSNPDLKISPDDLAYIMFTSGTSGNPKGVMVQHINVIHITSWFHHAYDLTRNKNIIQFTSYNFDPSVEQIFGALLHGATVHCADEEMKLNRKKLTDYIGRHHINLVNFTPATLRLLLMGEEKIPSLEVLICGGEVLDNDLKNDILKQGYSLYNHYGPTETTVDALVSQCSLNESVVLGKPIANTSIYIVNHNNQPQPIGVKGELCIAGAGITRGYLNNPELTDEKFVASPFNGYEKMYKTGDMARWLPDGTISFLGRKDDQVKLRGNRIELAEIEKQIVKHGNVNQCVVIVKEKEAGDQYICAYLVLKDKTIDSLSEVKQKLNEVLPSYMLPTYYMTIDQIPLKTSGKVDKRALPEVIELQSASEGPQNETEEKLSEIWKNLLDVNYVGRSDNFFDLGGHSLKATQLIARIYKEFEFELSLTEIFTTSTIKELAQHIQSKGKSDFSEIRQQAEREQYPASPAQKRLYFIHQIEGAETAYNRPCTFIIEGNVDVLKMEQAFGELIHRHEAFRTTYSIANGEVMQVIQKHVPFEMEYEHSAASDCQQVIASFIRPFDLEKAPLCRLKLVRMENNKHLFLFDTHHITSDGTSMDIIVREFMELYKGNPLPEIKIQYKDYAVWKNENRHDSERMDRQKQYWMEQFSGEIPVLQLPIDYPRPFVQSFEGDMLHFELNDPVMIPLRKIASESGVTLNMLLLAIYNILLSKYSGQQDIIVGMPSAGRQHPDLEHIVGMFVNTVAVRNYLDMEQSFTDFLAVVKENALNAFENEDYQFEELLNAIQLERDLSRNPLFDTMFVIQNASGKDSILNNTANEPFIIDNLTFTPYTPGYGPAHFDIFLEGFEAGDTLRFNLHYCSRLFKKQTMEAMIGHFKNIIQRIIEGTNVRLKDIRLISPEEEKYILGHYNPASKPYPTHKTIHELFEEQAARTPNRTAIICYGERLTYDELNKQSNKLARALRNRGIGADSVVGVKLERSFALIIGILGVLKAGAAYLPLDVNCPAERLSYIINDANISWILTAASEGAGVPVEMMLSLEQLEPELVHEDAGDLGICNTSNDLLYVIYTSGSTGKPKGIMFEHKNMVNLICFEYESVNFAASVLLFNATTFDMSPNEIFSTLLAGGTLHVIHEEMKRDVEGLFRYMAAENVEVAIFPTAYLKFITSEEQLARQIPSNIRHILTAGEQLVINDQLRMYLKKNGTHLHNQYGPTETHVVTELIMKHGDVIADVPSIGKPVTNNDIYVLDPYDNLQPIGIAGELCVAGDNVARGYMNKPELSAVRFTSDPYIAGRRMYRTGDQVKWLPDGNLAFVGRKDFQIKIRGFRVEPDEIESVLLKHPDIKEAVVIAKTDSKGSNYLLAYLTSKAVTAVSELRRFLEDAVPDYMIPSKFVFIDQFPLTTSGKIDRIQLKSREEAAPVKANLPPQSGIEIKLSSIWKQILEVDQVSTEDHFFEEGGHSLKAIQMVLQVEREFNVQLKVSHIFRFPIFKALAACIGSLPGNRAAEIPALEARGTYDTSFAQRRMYILNKMESNSTAYNLTSVFYVEGIISKEKIGQAVSQLIMRHEPLRTCFEILNGEVVQRIVPAVSAEMEFMSCADCDISSVLNTWVRPFDLGQAPLFRSAVVSTNESSHYLLFDMHHIAADGLSMVILLKEFMEIYNDKSLEPLSLQYKDIAAWQIANLQLPPMLEAQNFWMNSLKGNLPALNLPTDYLRPVKKSYEGDFIEIKVGKDLYRRLQHVNQASGSTLFMLLLAAYNVLLYKYTAQNDILIGSPVAGRTRKEEEHSVGMFVNTVVMRNLLQGEQTFNSFLSEVRDNSLRVIENQSYPFDKLIDELEIPRDMGRNPVFDTMFSMNNISFSKLVIGGLEAQPVELTNKTSKFDISVSATELEEEMVLAFEYCTKLFTEQTIQRMANHYINILDSITRDSSKTINSINILSIPEQKELLEKFNETALPFREEYTLQALFEERVEICPDRTALVYEGNEITYRDLNHKANKVASVLRSKGVGPDITVGVMMKSSPELFIAILGILKAGGAFLPMDCNYPKERLMYILENSNSRLVLSDEGAQALENLQQLEVMKIDEILSGKAESSNPEHINTANDLAYIIYTSGTTGNPKGVAIEHRSVNNCLTEIARATKFGEGKSILALTSASFDVFVMQSLLPLITGMKIVVPTESDKADTLRIRQIIEKQGIDMLSATPSRMIMLAGEGGDLSWMSSLKVCMLAGEAFPESLMQTLGRIPNLQVYNMYGPTETTIISSIKHLLPDAPINLGKPISNTTMYILDSEQRLQPIGVAGELYIGGAGLARGYWNQPELTAEKFIQNPYREGERIYRTGDLAKWTPEGEVEYLGRIDNQVKLRGYRIELEEIQKNLGEVPGIMNCIVRIIGEAPESAYLAGYYEAEHEIPVPVITAHLAAILPHYMIPRVYVYLEQMPLNTNAKIDITALPEPLLSHRQLNPAAPVSYSQIEQQLIDIWKSVLGLDYIDINDNFFELGGNSIQVVRVHAMVEKLYPDKVEIADFFTYSSISEMAEAIESSDTALGRIELHVVNLHADFRRTGGNVDTRTGSIKMAMAGLDAKLTELSNRYGTSKDHILQGLFMYLLQEYSADRSISIHYALNDNGDVLPLTINPSSIESVADLFGTISEQAVLLPKPAGFNLNEAMRLTHVKQDEAVSLLYLGHRHFGGQLSETFDIILKTDAGPEISHVLFEYNAGRLQTDFMKEMGNRLMKMIQSA